MPPKLLSALKSFTVGATAYSVLISPLVYTAAYGRVPNDAGIMIYISSMPSGSLINLIGYFESRAWIASKFNHLVDDRLAMVFDASVGWFFGCIQWGIVAALLWILFKRSYNSNNK